jgi:hypothetical protein
LIARAEQDEATELVYGSWEPIVDTFFKEAAAIAYVPPPLTVSNGVVMRPRAVVSMLLRREAWSAVDGFPEDLRSAEDLLFMNRLEAAGYRPVFEPRAQVHWNLRATLADTFKRFVIYSRNNIRAGLWRQWQKTILTRYAVLLVLLVLSLIVDWRWVWVPVAAWLLMLVLRTLVSIRRNRHCYPASFLRNLARVPLIVCVLAALDAAAIIGSVQWLCFDAFRSPRTKTLEAGNGA